MFVFLSKDRTKSLNILLYSPARRIRKKCWLALLFSKCSFYIMCSNALRFYCELLQPLNILVAIENLDFLLISNCKHIYLRN